MALLILAITIGCNKDDDDDDNNVKCGDNWVASQEFQDELEKLTEAAQTYGMDPTTENCEAYRAAYLNYLDEVRDFEECYIAVGQQQAFLDAVNAAEMAINDLQC